MTSLRDQQKLDGAIAPLIIMCAIAKRAPTATLDVSPMTPEPCSTNSAMPARHAFQRHLSLACRDKCVHRFVELRRSSTSTGKEQPQVLQQFARHSRPASRCRGFG